MTVIKTTPHDPRALALFSRHDDFMIDFLGPDQKFYTRYTGAEAIEAVWLALEDDRPMGCIAFRKKDDTTGEVKRLFVQESFRGKGVSRPLLAALRAHAEAQGCRKLFLDTRITLEPAASLYQRMGFRITYRQGLYVQMELEL